MVGQPQAPTLAILVFIAEHHVIQYRLSLQQFGSAVPAVSPPHLLPAPACSLGKAERGKEKATMLCKHCSAIAKTSVRYPHSFSHKSETQHHTG